MLRIQIEFPISALLLFDYIKCLKIKLRVYLHICRILCSTKIEYNLRIVLRMKFVM